jgi:hypothetical protein
LKVVNYLGLHIIYQVIWAVGQRKNLWLHIRTLIIIGFQRITPILLISILLDMLSDKGLINITPFPFHQVQDQWWMTRDSNVLSCLFTEESQHPVAQVKQRRKCDRIRFSHILHPSVFAFMLWLTLFM